MKFSNQEIFYGNLFIALIGIQIFFLILLLAVMIESIIYHWSKIIKFLRRTIRTYRLIRIYLLSEKKIKIERSIKARLNKLKMHDSDLIKIIGGKK